MLQEAKKIVPEIEPHKSDQLEITFFTDPLCCWSWAFEPQWRRLRFEFDGKINWRYCMAGLVPDWNSYNDVANSVNRPIQMGPVWMHASQLSGMPMQTRIWMEDPPASSYPACIAVKSASLQSLEAGEKYLRLTREAIMINGENIANMNVLENIAKKLADKHPEQLNLQQFKEDLYNENGLNAFKADMGQVQLSGINRYPSLLFRYAKEKSILITGYRSYAVLLDAIRQIAPALQKTQTAAKASNYIDYWENITDTELKEASL